MTWDDMHLCTIHDTLKGVWVTNTAAMAVYIGLSMLEGVSSVSKDPSTTLQDASVLTAQRAAQLFFMLSLLSYAEN